MQCREFSRMADLSDKQLSKLYNTLWYLIESVPIGGKKTFNQPRAQCNCKRSSSVKYMPKVISDHTRNVKIVKISLLDVNLVFTSHTLSAWVVHQIVDINIQGHS